MSMYSKIKSISKILIYFSVFALLLSGGSFYLSKNEVGADIDPQVGVKVYIHTSGSNPTRVTAFGLSGSRFTQNLSEFNNNNDDVEYITGGSEECRQVNNQQDPTCFAINVGLWSNPSIDANQERAAWDFIKQINGNGESSGDNNLIKLIKSNYVAAAWAEWGDVDVQNDRVYITSEDLFNQLKSSNIDLDKEVAYCTETNHCELNSSTTGLIIYLKDSYTGAKNNSVWILGVDFVLGSAFPVFENEGMDLIEKRKFLTDHRTNYLNDANRKSQSGNYLTLDSPPEIVLNSGTADGTVPKTFKATVDLSSFSSSLGDALRIKAYVKPMKGSGSSPAILIGPEVIPNSQFGTDSDYLFDFSWDSDIKNASFSPTPSGDTGVLYDRSFPQEYIVKIILIKCASSTCDDLDADETLDEVESSFNTQSSTGNGPLKGESDDYFDLVVSPSQTTPGESVSAEVTAKSHDPADPKDPPVSEMSHVDVFACKGRKSINSSADASCNQNKMGRLSVTEKPKATFSWTPDENELDYYTIVGKGFSKNGEMIPNAYNSVEIIVSNSEQSIDEQNPVSSVVSNLINFSELASENERGSTIRTTWELVKRIVDLFLLVIGILSVIAIIIGGIIYITSGGDPDKAKKGQKAVVYAIYGIVIASLAWVIESVLLDTLEKIGLIEKL